MLKAISKKIRGEIFLTTHFSILVSPIYIIRRGLYVAIKKVAPLFKGRILDFGCGSKPYESLFKSADLYVGVDMESTGHPHHKSRVDIFYDGLKLPFPDKSFDGVVSFEVFEHVFNLDEVLIEIHRVLKNGGILLLTTPFAWDEHEAPHDFARYTCFGLRDILNRAGFKIIEESKTAGYVLAIGQLFIAYLYQHVLPRGYFFSKIAQLAIVFPLNIFFLGLDLILPRRYQFYCNNVMVARAE